MMVIFILALFSDSIFFLIALISLLDLDQHLKVYTGPLYLLLEERCQAQRSRGICCRASDHLLLVSLSSHYHRLIMIILANNRRALLRTLESVYLIVIVDSRNAHRVLGRGLRTLVLI